MQSLISGTFVGLLLKKVMSYGLQADLFQVLMPVGNPDESVTNRPVLFRRARRLASGSRARHRRSASPAGQARHAGLHRPVRWQAHALLLPADRH